MNLPIAVIICALSVVTDAHYAEVSVPWKIPPHKAHAFLKAPSRNKRSDPRCNTDETYCENNMNSCMLHNEQTREYKCGRELTCTAGQSCYLSIPCPVHYELGCTDNLCLSFPCKSGGTCSVVNGRHHCQCVPGYDPATDCATDYDECQSNPCQNGGTCLNLFNAFSCNCVPGYDPATHCATDYDECQSNPCQHGGTCLNLFNAFSCNCVPGYDPATHCATDFDECQSNPCANGGSCNNLFNSFSCGCTNRYNGTTCEKDCRPGPVDIVFLVDTSSSLENDVNRSIDFIVEFVRKVPIGPNDFQIGVVTFNFDPSVLFDLDDYASENDILADLGKIKGEDAPTFTAPALQKAGQMLRSGSMGARAGVSSYIILLYDGLSTDRKDAVTKARTIRSMGGRIMTVGIGNSISHSEMLQISGNNHYTFSTLHVEDMYSIILSETAHPDCTDCSLQTSTDVIILLETTNNQTAKGYRDRQTAIRLTIQEVLNYNSDARIGMYSYSEEVDEVFSLSLSSNKDKLIAAALQVNMDKQNSESNTSHALQHMRAKNVFTSTRNLIIVLSDANWNDQSEILGEVELLKQNGVEVVGVITGEDCNVDSFNNIIKDRSQLFAIVFDDSTSLDVLAGMTKYYQCVNNIFTLRQ